MGLFKGELPVFANYRPFGRRGVRQDAVSLSRARWSIYRLPSLVYKRVNWRIQSGSFGLLIYREATICDEYA